MAAKLFTIILRIERAHKRGQRLWVFWCVVFLLSHNKRSEFSPIAKNFQLDMHFLVLAWLRNQFHIR